MATKTTNVPMADGLYCLWTEEGVYAVRIDQGANDATANDIAAVCRWSREHLADCETMDDMPTVSRSLADAICEACDLHPELVAVCRID